MWIRIQIREETNIILSFEKPRPKYQGLHFLANLLSLTPLDSRDYTSKAQGKVKGSDPKYGELSWMTRKPILFFFW